MIVFAAGLWACLASAVNATRYSWLALARGVRGLARPPMWAMLVRSRSWPVGMGRELATRAERRAARGVVAWLMVVVGVGSLLLIFATMGQHDILAGTVSSGTWDGGVLYLSSAEGTRTGLTCVIKPDKGETRSVVLPREQSGGRGDTHGEILTRWFDGSASVACYGEVRMSTQPWPVGFWLAGHSWMIIPAVILTAFGWMLTPSRSVVRTCD